jgi:hypothetical protein
LQCLTNQGDSLNDTSPYVYRLILSTAAANMPLDVASAIVSFISLSGQVLQGCNYLCDFFAEAKDAPAIIQNISDHLEVIQPALSTLRATFLGIQAGPQSLPGLQDPNPALKKCESAIVDLKAFVDRHGGICKPPSTTLQAHPALVCAASGSSPGPGAISTSNTSFYKRSALRRGWHRLDVARKANKLRGLAAHLEQAKSSLQLVQANIGLTQAQYQTILVQEMKVAQEQVRDTQSALGQMYAETKAVSLGLHGDTHASLNRITFESQTNSAHLTTLAQFASESRDSSRATADAIGSLCRDFTNKLDGLPAAMAPMVERAAAKALAEHDATDRARPQKSSRQNALGLEDEAIGAGTNAACQGKSNIREISRISQSCIIPRKNYRASGYKENEFTSFVLKRGPKRQQRSTSIVNVWFGRIIITTTVTEQEDRTGMDSLDVLRLYAKTINVSFFPLTSLLRTGVCIQFGDSKTGIYHPSWDNRLRVFRLHEEDSPLAQALRSADYLQSRRMLQDREVTQHDMVDGKSIFEYLTMQIALRVGRRKTKQCFEQWVMIAKLLISLGSDCGDGQALKNACEALDLYSEKDLERLIDMLIRMIISHSESDPFNEPTLSYLANFRLDCGMWKLWPLLLAQDEWDLSELQQSFQKIWGMDSWQYLVVESGDNYKWDDQQKRRWIQLPLSLRQDKEYCVGEFGKDFVKYVWPLLYWRDQRPPFWHSRKTCQEFFGPDFVRHDWPSLLQEQSFDHVEGKGAWQHHFTTHYVRKSRYIENQEPWVKSMAEKWKCEEEDLRHCRRHCIEQYGTNFVRDELPSLLRL